MPRVEIDGALALVTGAGGGIGRAAATALASRGARVLCTGRDLESAETTAGLCRDAGRREAASYRLDVTDRAGMQAFAALPGLVSRTSPPRPRCWRSPAACAPTSVHTGSASQQSARP